MVGKYAFPSPRYEEPEKSMVAKIVEIYSTISVIRRFITEFTKAHH
jgi:hypothetical protein